MVRRPMKGRRRARPIAQAVVISGLGLVSFSAQEPG
jgi:hypothetical protein